MTDGQRSEISSHPRFKLMQAPIPHIDGGTVMGQYIHPNDAVVVLPLFENRDVLLIRNHRFALDLELWELPAGTIDPGEDPLTCAGRELEEETGYRAQTIQPLTDFVTCPGLCTERIHAFLATNLTRTQQSLDPTERIIPERRSWIQTMQMIREGTIADAKTITALLYAAKFTDGIHP
ncbi:NUDIX hydrolase [Mucisphaera sp.]|uniref:NUDIX hydrolase n=1 Tax=Mucisphaera sp. TaxID=2913024 RepID=UPI003D13C020